MSEPVTWSVERAGADVVLRAAIEAPWHVYALRPPPPDVLDGPDAWAAGPGPAPTRVTVEAPGTVSAVLEPEPEAVFDPGFGRTVLVHHGPLELRVTTDADRLTVTYQACDGQRCLPPVTVAVDTHHSS